MKKNNLIEVRNLSVKFKKAGKDFVAVNRANLEIEKREIVGLVGESGSGKTTLGKALLSIWPHATGRVLIDGVKTPRKAITSVTRKNEWVYKKGQLIFQDPSSSLQNSRKVLDIVLEGYRNFNIFEETKKEKLANIDKKIFEQKQKILFVENAKEWKKNLYESEYKLFEERKLDELESNSSQKMLEDLESERDDLKNWFNNSKKMIDGRVKSEILHFEEDRISFNKSTSITKKNIKDELFVYKKEKITKEKLLKSSLKASRYLYKRIYDSKKTEDKLFYKTVQEKFDSTQDKLLETMLNITIESPWSSKSFRDYIVSFIKDIRKHTHYCEDNIFDINQKLKENPRNKILLKENELFKESIKVNDEIIEKFLSLLTDHLSSPSNKFFVETKKLYKFIIGLKITISSHEGKDYHTILKREYKKNLDEINKKIRKIDLDKEKKITEESLIRQFNNLFKKEILKLKTPKTKLKNLTSIKNKIKKYKKERNKILDTYSSSNKKEIEKKVAVEALDIVGLSSSYLNRYPGDFSGGQKQRIGIARTILSKPEFIIADEPISALDVSIQAQVVNILKTLRDKLGITIIFIAHDLEMVKYIADKIVVMYRGDIVEKGEAKKIAEKPYHPYTRSLLSAIPDVSKIGEGFNIEDYDSSIHGYNKYTKIEMKKVEADHFVRGTQEEITKWKKQANK